jgi:superfamily I DNA/RNA helicase/RecB family exonuclease
VTAPASQPAETRIVPDDWPRHLGITDGPQLIVGGPGAGKTEFLVRRAATLIDGGGCRPENLLVLTFSRRGAADLADRIHERLGRTVRGIDASTFHSLAMRMLETHAEKRGWAGAPTVLTGPDQQRLVATLLAEEDPERWSPAHRAMIGSRTFAAEVTDFVLRCRERLLGPDDLERLAAELHEWRGLPGFLARYDTELRARRQVDYGTLLAEAVALLADPEVSAAAADQYRYVLVDEYQDTTTAQAVMLGRLVATHGNLTAAADPYQSIYSFRGADLANVARFPMDFRDAEGGLATRIVLTTSHRVPAAILEAAVRVTHHELPGAAGAVTPADGPGSVETYRFEQQTEEAEWIASEVTRLSLEQRIPYRRIGVLVRSKRRLIPDLSRALQRRGVPHDRPDARLVDEPAVRYVHDLVLAATGEGGGPETDRAVRRILLGPFHRLPLGQMRDLERSRARTGSSWAELVATERPDLEPLAALVGDPGWATGMPAAEGLWEVWIHLAALIADAIGDGTTEHAAAWSAYAEILDRWRDREPAGTLAVHRRLSEDEDFEATPLLTHSAGGEDRLTITTMHQSKGLEFDVVFIADAVEGVFPDLRARDSLLGARRLNPDLPADPAGYLAFRLQEERRLAYTAMTRATRRVVWTATASGFEEGRGIPSRFLALVAGVDSVAEAAKSPPVGRPPVTPLEIEGALRRLLGDPASPSADRLAALELLAAGSPVLRSPDEYFGLRRRGDDAGLIEEAFTLSPSQADLYESCPRRYAMERRLGIGDETSVHAEFGSLVHDVLEVAETEAVAAGHDRSDLAGAEDALRRLFDPGVFGGGPFAEAWRRRAVEALRNLYAHWPGAGVPIALEHPLEASMAGVHWRGRADRIERRQAGTTIVDYKTAKRATQVKDAARSMQLGFYMLAAAADPAIAAHGPVVGAELWFPLAKLAKAITVRPFDPANLDEIRERMHIVADAIAAEDWPAKSGDHCSHCRVRSSCPAWPEGREAFAT